MDVIIIVVLDDDDMGNSIFFFLFFRLNFFMQIKHRETICVQQMIHRYAEAEKHCSRELHLSPSPFMIVSHTLLYKVDKFKNSLISSHWRRGAYTSKISTPDLLKWGGGKALHVGSSHSSELNLCLVTSCSRLVR